MFTLPCFARDVYLNSCLNSCLNSKFVLHSCRFRYFFCVYKQFRCFWAHFCEISDANHFGENRF